MVWCGRVWIELVCYGKKWLVLVRFGIIRSGLAGLMMYGVACEPSKSAPAGVNITAFPAPLDYTILED